MLNFFLGKKRIDGYWYSKGIQHAHVFHKLCLYFEFYFLSSLTFFIATRKNDTYFLLKQEHSWPFRMNPSKIVLSPVS